MKGNKKKIFIEALEQRIMLDGAGASTALDVIDERNKEKLLNKNQKISKLSENKIEDNSQKLPFDQMARDQKRNDRKQVVFIDSQVQDYQTLIDAFNKDTEVYLIQSNEDGFKKIDKVLKNDADISSLHIIGHGSAGKILFGNAALSNDTIKSYNHTLRSIGQSLTEDGDILFYGCNVASTEGGKTLISKISEITKADIAASDDITGKGGDWDLEKKIGIVETKNVRVVGYDHSLLQNGITSINSNVIEPSSGYTKNFQARAENSSSLGNDSGGDFVVVLERENITANTNLSFDERPSGSSASHNPSTDGAVNSYLVIMNSDRSSSGRTSNLGQIVFTNEIYGFFTDPSNTIAMSNISMSGATYATSSDTGFNKRSFENLQFYNSSTSSSSSSVDWISVGSDKRTVRMGTENGQKGDFFRVITAAGSSVSAAANTATVNEDDTITVTNGETTQNQTYEVNDTIDSSTSLTVGSDTHGSGISFSHDGKKMFKTDYQIDQIHQWTLSTAFDPTSISGSPTSANLDFDTSDSMGTGAGDYPVGHAWNSDGTKLFVANWDGVDEYWIHSYDLSTAYDVSTISLVSPSASNSYNTGLYNVKSLAVSSDGTKFYFLEDNARQVRQITFATAYDVTSSASSATLSISDTTYPRSLALSDNGKKLFVGDTSGERIYQYNLTTAWDVSSGVSLDGYITLTTTIDPFGIVFTHGGTKMLVLDEAGETVDVHSLKSPFNLIDIDDEHDGDVLLDDTGSSLTVTQIAVTGSSNSAVASSSSYNSNGTSVTGTYGTLTIGADGSYTYDADQNAADALDAGDIVTDSFTYTTSNGSTTDTATLIITVIGVNDTPVADDEVDSVAVENTEIVTDGALDLLFDDTDADASASLSVSSIVATTAGGSATTVNPGTAYNSGYTSVDGSYGTLRIGSDGTYQYTANSSTGTDVFTYTLFDGSATDEATLTISITNTAPVAQDDTGVVNEDDTLVVADGTNLTSVDAATVDGSPLNVASQLPAMRGITFNNDGTKMFLTGQSSDAVSEYHLTTAFDVSTASLDSSFSVSGQESAPTSVKFNDDGTKMFVTGTGSSSIHEYTLSTAFDVSTASLEDSLNVSSKDGNPFGLDFNNDGTKMYFTGDDGNKIYEYNLSTGFDLGTASFNQELSLGSQDVEPFGIEFSPDGTRMFIVGTRDNGIDEYVLTTGFDISTASHVCFLYTRYTNAINPSGIAFSEDGFKMFIVGNNDNAGSNNDQVDEYALVSPFSLCNAAGNFTGDLVDSTNASSRDTDADGQTVTVTSVRTGSSEGNGTGGDVASGSSYNSNGTSVTGTYGTLTVGADGSYSYAADQDAADALDVGDMVTESFNYTVSDGSGGTDIAVLTITINGINDVPVADDETNSVNVSTTLNVPDGTDDVLDGDTDADASSSLTVTGIRTGTEIAGSGTDGTVGSGLAGSYGTLTIAADGTYTYVANASGGIDYFTYTVSDGIGGTDTAQITITVNAAPVAADNTGIVNEDGTLTVSDGADANSITTAAITYDANDIFDMSAVSGENNSAGLAFNNDGTRMFHGGNDGDAIKEYHLSTAYDVSTATYQGDAQKLDVSGQTTEPFGLTFNNDGTKLFVTGGLGAGKVFQYTLGTAYDVSTQTGSVVEFAAGDTRPCGIRFNNDGTKLFVAGFNGGNIEEIHLSTAYDLSTASRSDSNRLDISAKETLPRDIEFNIDGTRMFVVGGQGKDITEYKLSTAYDVSTGTYVGEYNIRYAPDGSQVDSEPFSLLFNKMGTKMFMMGYNSDDVHEYNLTSPYNLINVKDEHDGDVLEDDTDANTSDTLTVTSVRTGSSEGNGTGGNVASGSSYNSNGTSVTGTYGTLTIGADGSYSYAADQDAADALDSGDVVTDSFNYTVSDGSLTDIAVLEITVIGINDNPTAVADTDVVNSGNTVTDATNSAGTLVSDDTDPDASASLFITQVTPSGGSATDITHNSTKLSNAATISGAKGTLTIGSDGSYSYAANSDATSGNDVFTYTLSDGASISTSTLTITVTGNNAPTASNSTVYISENNQVSSAGDRTPSNITKIFAASDFNFSDSDSDSLSKIKITTLESAGALEYYNGSSWTDVTSNQEISAADIANNYLRFTPAANSESDVTFAFKVHDGTEYSSSAYTMTISVNAAPNVTDTTVGSTVSAGGTSSGDVHDNVADSDDADSVLVVTGVASGNESSNNTIVTNGTGVGSSVTGTYGTLNIAANGTYTYTANATNNIAFGATATDTFTFTTRDDETNAGSFAYDVGTITFTVASSIALVDDTDSVNEDATVTKTGSEDDVLNDDTADSDGLVITHIKKDGGTNSTVASGSTYVSNGTSVTGTYGTLTIGADGSYTYVADQAAADALDAGDQVNDIFVYTADGATANLTITVTGVNDAPVAVDDTDAVNEDATIIVDSGADLLMADDTDADASSSITVTQIAVTGGSDSAVAGGSSYNSSGTSIVGTYGTLTVGADGTYTYTADQSAADALDAGDTETDSFTYTISDGTTTTTATLIITVTGVNDRPTAGNETIYINENNTDASFGTRTSQNITHTFADSDFTNYSDADADDGVGIRIKSLPTGTLSKISNGAVQSVNDYITNMSNLKYTPPANSEADDSFNYRAYDGSLVGSNERTITISVNAAPVAVNDTDSITAGDADATGNVLTNDTDADDAASALAIRGVGAVPESSTMLGNANVGSAVTGTYGNLTISYSGAYTYSVSGNANTVALRAGETATDVFSYKVMDDETNAGSKAIDIGTITFTITGIDGDAIGEPDPDEPPKLKEKKKDKKQKREERKELKRLKREKRLERKELKIPKSNLEKNAEFNQGLKLVDLVAESKSLELKDKDKDIYLDKIIAKYSDKNLKVKFKVFDDEGKEVQKYYGEMKDGSPLPDWIKVDPKTGKTKTDIPKGVKMVEFKIIAIDTENNKKQVTVVIDAKKIAQDKEILKQSRKIERAKKLEVTNDGSVKLNSINKEGKIDKTKTEAINEIKEIDKLVKTIEPDEFLNLEAKVEKENFEVELPWQNLKVVLNNGQELPEWIKYDPKTGKVTATPPENVKTIDLKVIIENPDGELSVKDIKLNFVDKNAQETKNISDNETKFVSLSSQLSKEYSDWDNYGSQLIDRL